MPRQRCPFYGFSWPEGTSHLHDENDNRCALLFGVAQHCVMERDRLTVNHRICPVYLEREALIQIAVRHITVHPKENPEGVRLDEWTEYVNP